MLNITASEDSFLTEVPQNPSITVVICVFIYRPSPPREDCMTRMPIWRLYIKRGHMAQGQFQTERAK